VDSATRKLIEGLPDGILALSFIDVHDDLLDCKPVFASRLRPEASRRIDQVLATLREISSAAQGRSFKWGIPASAPLLTIGSEGAHQVGQQGHGSSLLGAISFTWTIVPIGSENKARKLQRWFALHNSSIHVELIDEATNVPVAAWDFDIGDDNSPGCHFHSKSLPLARDNAPNIDIPRMPTLLYTLTDALDFVVGELWQEEWRKESGAKTPEMQRWRPRTLKRMQALVDWYRTKTRESSLSGWMTLKCAKPRALEWTN
jgi:hypothetical protein